MAAIFDQPKEFMEDLFGGLIDILEKGFGDAGAKMRIVHPIDDVDTFNYEGIPGNINVRLAPFGRY